MPLFTGLKIMEAGEKYAGQMGWLFTEKIVRCGMEGNLLPPEKL